MSPNLENSLWRFLDALTRALDTLQPFIQKSVEDEMGDTPLTLKPKKKTEPKPAPPVSDENLPF